jgi:7,8-dihydro-6-hydroxymethylpterin-pyrophosphokinase
MIERAFVLRPLADIAPDFIHPILKQTVSELLAELPPDDGILKITDW